MTNTRNTVETKVVSHAQLTDYRTKAQKEKKNPESSWDEITKVQ